MIIDNTPTKKADMSSGMEQTQFTIKNSSKVYQILSSGIYSDAITAIIRELSCNAYDSHVSVGKSDVPFDVHLPTSYEPHFSIRDYGSGLSEEQLRKLYTTYGESTKTDSDDFVGALGLGSKSPFSYTTNFTVTSYYHGMKYIYSAFVDDEGIPALVNMFSGKEDAPNGVEVKFSVNSSSDQYSFAQKAANVYRWFKTQPNISGNRIKTNPVAPSLVVKEDTYYFAEHSIGSFVVMGGVAYPIKVDSIDSSSALRAGFTSQDHGLMNLFKMNFIINCPIGSVDFASSREHLRFTKKTISYILTALKEVHELSYPLFEQKVEEKKKEKNYQKGDRRALSGIVYTVQQSFNHFGMGLFVRYCEEHKDEVLPLDTTKRNFERLQITVKEMAEFGYTLDVLSLSSSYYNSGKKTVNVDGRPDETYYEYHSSDIKRTIVTPGKKPVSRKKFAYGGEARRSYFFLKPIEGKTQDLDGFRKKFYLDFIPVMSGDDFPNPPKEAPSVKQNILTLKMPRYHTSSGDLAWETLSQDQYDELLKTDKTVIYLNMKGYALPDFEGSDPKEMAYNLNPLIDVNKHQLVFVRAGGKDLIQDEWVSYKDFVESKLSDITDENYLSMYSEPLGETIKTLILFMHSEKAKDTVLPKVIGDIEKIISDTSYIKSVFTSLTSCGITIPEEKTKEAKDKINQLKDKYPVLWLIRPPKIYDTSGRYVSQEIRDNYKKSITDIINYIESQEQSRP